MKFAQWVFRIAGIYGLLALLPMYALEKQVGMDYPPAITHPENYYGFIGVAVAWQFAFLIIGQDPIRYRLLMLPAVLEKFSFAGAIAVLLLQGRVAGPVIAFAGVDFLLGLLFIWAFLSLRNSQPTA